MIEHPTLRACGVGHSFGTRGDALPPGAVRPRQVHGARVASAAECAAGIDALRREAQGAPLRAVIGPHIGPCCYEVDAPVLDALRHFDADLDAATTASRPGHHWLDLGALARSALLRAGVSPDAIGSVERPCTHCDAQRFHSYRRDGARAGRLVHWIVAANP